MSQDKELLKKVYNAYIDFDNELHAKERDGHKINLAYTILDSIMSNVFDAINK